MINQLENKLDDIIDSLTEEKEHKWKNDRSSYKLFKGPRDAGTLKFKDIAEYVLNNEGTMGSVVGSKKNSSLSVQFYHEKHGIVETSRYEMSSYTLFSIKYEYSSPKRRWVVADYKDLQYKTEKQWKTALKRYHKGITSLKKYNEIFKGQ